MLKKILGYVSRAVLWVLSTVGLDSPNRLVIALSPLFVAAAGWISADLATLVPGLGHLDPVEIMGVFVAGATFATTKVLLWLRGWQKFEAKALPAGPAPPTTTTGGAAAAAVTDPPAPLRVAPEPVPEVGRL